MIDRKIAAGVELTVMKGSWTVSCADHVMATVAAEVRRRRARYCPRQETAPGSER